MSSTSKSFVSLKRKKIKIDSPIIVILICFEGYGECVNRSELFTMNVKNPSAFYKSACYLGQ